MPARLNVLRNVLSNLLYYFRPLSKKAEIRILMYHRINDSYPDDRLCVSLLEFKKQMEFLKKNSFEVISLQEAVRLLSNKQAQTEVKISRYDKPKIVITFDDGYLDNYTHAFPVLKEYNFAATIFLTVNNIGVKSEFLTWEYISEMTQSKITLGSHSMTHAKLAGIPIDKAKWEIFDSRKLIQEKGVACDYFCYPKGDYNSEVPDLVKKASYQAALTTHPGPNRCGQNLFALRRTEISGRDNIFDFEKKIFGAFDLLHLLIQKLKSRKPVLKKEKPIKILYVIWSLGLGGAERVVISLAKGLDKTKFQPTVCCLNGKGAFAHELEELGIKVIALNKKAGIDISVASKIIKVIKNNKIDIVHTHLWGANFWGRIAAKLAGVKGIIVTEHNTDVWKSRLYFMFDKLLSRWTDRIIVVSNSVKDFYVSKGIDEKKIEVIYNGVEIEKLQGCKETRTLIKKEFGIKDDEKVLAIIGRLVPQKGHKYLFEALSQLNGSYKIKLLVVGAGPIEKDLRSTVCGLQLQGKVIFTGLREDVKDILSITNVLVMPSTREGLPMVALEAMAQGVPVIATKVGGVPDLVSDNETGILVESNNHFALKEALSKIIEDEGLTQRLGENAKKSVQEKFSIEGMLNKTQTLYEACLIHKTR